MSSYSNSNSFLVSSVPMSSYRRVMNEIHVLLVDHDQFNYFDTKVLLEICDYRVTHVQAAAEAIFMLSNELNFDLVIANINSPDAQGFKLLHAAVELDIPIILMSIQDDTVSAMKAIEIGALLFIKTPTTLEMLRCLWQHVLREKARAPLARAARERERLMANYIAPRGIEFGEVARHYPQENLNDVVVGGDSLFMMKEKGQLRRSYNKGKRVEEEYDSDSELNSNNHGKVRRKICTEWTQELHEKFIEAVKQLGEGRCFPKEILELMNVPGLTRMQVASHLQKCRNENWRSFRERKSTLGSMDINGGPNHKQRRFGSMPRVLKALSDHEAYGQAGGGGLGSGSYSESEVGTQNTMAIETSMANQITYHQDYDALVPHNNILLGVNSSDLRHLSSVDGFFTSDNDCTVLNFSDPPQGFVGTNHPQSSPGAFPNFEPDAYVQDQTNSKGAASMDSRWTGSETSNFCSEEDSHTNQNL